jgi:hypothetical protein
MAVRFRMVRYTRARRLASCTDEKMASRRPLETLLVTGRELVERGLKQRKTNWREWDERLSVKALEARLDRSRKLWIVYGDMIETEFRAEREVIEKEIARVRASPRWPLSRNAPNGLPMWWPFGTTPDRISRQR